MTNDRDKLIQKAQSLGIDFDGGLVTVKELQEKIKKAQTNTSAVQPVQSVKSTEDPVIGATMRCWNCKNHGVKPTPRLNNDGVCENCGFDVKTVYNGDLEAAKAKQRAAQALQQQ